MDAANQEGAFTVERAWIVKKYSWAQGYARAVKDICHLIDSEGKDGDEYG